MREITSNFESIYFQKSTSVMCAAVWNCSLEIYNIHEYDNPYVCNNNVSYLNTINLNNFNDN